MPQGLSAHRPAAYPARPASRPAPRRPAACLSTRQRAGPRKRPAQRGHLSQLGPAPPELQQHREQLVAAEPGPPRSQRHHERAGRPQPAAPRLPKLAILREPTNRRPGPQARRIRYLVWILPWACGSVIRWLWAGWVRSLIGCRRPVTGVFWLTNGRSARSPQGRRRSRGTDG